MSEHKKIGPRELLDAVEKNSWGVIPMNCPTGGDDFEVVWNVVEYHQAEPHERIIGTADEYGGPMLAIRRAIWGQEAR